MRALLFLCVCGLGGCSNDVFTGGDSGSDSSAQDASAETSDDAANDSPSTTGDGGSAGCPVGATNNCTSCTGTCCVDHTGASCIVSQCVGQGTFALSCTSASDCTIASDTVCCLNVGATDVSKGCPRVIATVNDEPAASTCTTNSACTTVRLCDNGSQCASGRCSEATFSVDTSVTIGICDP